MNFKPLWQIKHSDRAEADRFFNFPYAAIEEALSNAVYHRAYDEREPIEVRVENDRIYFITRLFIHEAFMKSVDELEVGNISDNEMQKETSFETKGL